MSGTLKYQFTGFTFCPNEFELKSSKGKTVTLTPINYRLLRVFVENYGSILSVDDLIREVWPDKIEEVENETVTRQISYLRKALKQVSKKSNHIVNVKRRGYTLVAEVERISDDCNLVKNVIDHSQTSPRSNAEIWEKIIRLENNERRMEAMLNYLASIVSQQSIWISIMWNDISELRRTEIVHNSVQFANKNLIGPEQDLQISTLEGLGDRIDEVFNIHQKTSSIQELELAVNLSPFWNLQGYWSKGSERLQIALSNHPDRREDLQARALAWLSYLLYCQDKYELATQAAEKSKTISKQIDDSQSLALSLHTLASIAEVKGKYSQARILFNECLHAAQTANVVWLISWTYRKLGSIAEAEGNHSFAERLYLKSLRKREDIQDRFGIAFVQGYLSAITCAQDKINESREWIDKSMQCQNHNEVLAHCYLKLGIIEESSKQYQIAYNNYQRAYTLRLELNDKRGQARAIEGMAKAAYLIGNYKEAASLYGSAYQIRAAISAPLSPAEQKAYGELSRSLKKKHFREFEKGSERLSETLKS